MNSFIDCAAALAERRVRFVLIGLSGVNFYAGSAGTLFTTLDHDLFLPSDPDNLLAAWAICDNLGLDLSSGGEPLDRPRDRWLAERVVEHRALVRALAPDRLQLDLTLVMGGFDFDAVWAERRTFRVRDVDVPVARLSHIVRSKAEAGRDKDRLFLAAHESALKELLNGDGGDE